MLSIRLNGEQLELSFIYNDDYISRIRDIGGGVFDPSTKTWRMSKDKIYILKDRFRGEIMWLTPEYKITGENKPDYSHLYKNVPNDEIPPLIPYNLYNYQKFGANFLCHRALKYGFALLMDDMGTGKTLMALEASKLLQQKVRLNGYDIPILVVTKSGLKYQFAKDGVKKFFGDNYVIVDGSKSKRTKIYKDLKEHPTPYLIMSYETLRADIDLFKSYSIGLLILDEAHKAKNFKTAINQAICQLNKQYTYLLTGTPIGKSPLDLYGLGKIGNEDYFGNYRIFQKTYIRYVNTLYGVKELYKNLDQLLEKLNEISLRRTVLEIGVEMPEIIETNIELKPTESQLRIEKELMKKLDNVPLDKIIREIKEQMFAEVKKDIKPEVIGLFMNSNCSNILFESSKGLSIYAEKYIKNKDKLQSPKIEYLLEQLEELENEKVVIFSKYRTVTNLIAKELDKKKIEYVLFTGDQTAEQKEYARETFISSTTCNIILGTDAMAEGVSFSNAKYLINFDLALDVGINEQRKKRIRRMDSIHKNVFVYNYICGKGDELILKCLESKAKLIEYLVSNDEIKTKQLIDAMNKS